MNWAAPRVLPGGPIRQRRLGEVVVGAEFEPGGLVVEQVGRGEHEDWHAAAGADDLAPLGGHLRARPLPGPPAPGEYRLTDKGRDLWHVVGAMRQWGDRWAAPEGPSLNIRHAACGRVVQAVAVCSYCSEALDVSSVAAEAGPGAHAGDYHRTALEASDIARKVTPVGVFLGRFVGLSALVARLRS